MNNYNNSNNNNNGNNQERKPLVKIGGLWSKQTKNGAQMFTGAFGMGEIIILPNTNKQPGTNQPDFNMFIKEKEPMNNQQKPPVAPQNGGYAAPQNGYQKPAQNNYQKPNNNSNWQGGYQKQAPAQPSVQPQRPAYQPPQQEQQAEVAADEDYTTFSL